MTCAAGIDAALAPVSVVFLVDAPLGDTGPLPAELARAPGGPAPDVGYGRGRCTYIRRQPEHTVLHRVIREHLETFLAEARLRGGGEGLPRSSHRRRSAHELPRRCQRRCQASMAPRMRLTS